MKQSIVPDWAAAARAVELDRLKERLVKLIDKLAP